MFEKVNRSGLIIYLYYNRDAKKLQDYGDITYHSKKHRYLQLYVATEISKSWKHPLWAIFIERKTLSSKKFKKSVDNFLIIRYILNMLFI